MLQFDRTGTTFDDAVAPRAAGPSAVRIDPPPSPAQLVAAVAVQEMRFSTGRWGNPDRPSAVAGAIRPRPAIAVGTTPQNKGISRAVDFNRLEAIGWFGAKPQGNHVRTASRLRSEACPAKLGPVQGALL